MQGSGTKAMEIASTQRRWMDKPIWTELENLQEERVSMKRGSKEK